MALPITLHRYSDVLDQDGLASGLDAVFFQSSNTQSFVDDAARLRFRERWLGRYLSCDPQWAYVALTHDARVAGYVIGSVDDPASAPRFSDNPHFAVFKDLTRRYPAHLHINLAPEFRGAGLGTALITRFASAAKAALAPGVHVMTSRDARNVGFYKRNSFVEVGATGKGVHEVIFLGRNL